MNITIANTLDMLKRTSRFNLDYPITPALPRVTAAVAEINAVITALESAAQNQTGGFGEQQGAVDLRKERALDLRAYLRDVNRTARTLEEHPGISPIFRMPASASYPALIASAQSIIAAATPITTAFVAAGLAETFLADLEALLTSFEEATSRKAGGKLSRALNTAMLKAKANLGVQAAKRLDACVRNHFRNQPEKIAAWQVARHIQRAPRRSGGSGSGGSIPPDSGSGSSTPNGSGSPATATTNHNGQGAILA